MEDEWKPSKYCKIYQEMNKPTIESISKICKFKHSKWPIYSGTFFTNYPVASKSDYYAWQSHYQSGSWESDIWIMNTTDFKYAWPYHAAFIAQCVGE